MARGLLESSRGTVVPHMLVVYTYSTTLTGQTSELYNHYQVQVSAKLTLLGTTNNNNILESELGC